MTHEEMLDTLLDVCAIAHSTIDRYTDEATPVENDRLAEALETIRGRLCWPVGGARRKDWLDMGDFRLVRFHAGDTTTFVGTRKTEIKEQGMLIEGRVCKLDGLMNTATVTVNGERVLNASVNGGLHKAERVLVGAMHGFNGWKRAGRKHSKANAE